MSSVAQISVAVATLNQPERLARCLDALLSGDVLPAEIIVVDQSQNDATQLLIAQRQASSTPLIYKRQHRRGLSVSRNAAVELARFPVLAVTDDDCIPDASWVSAIERAFAGAANPDVVTGRVLPFGADVPGQYAVSSRTSTTPRIFRRLEKPWVIGTGGNCAYKLAWAKHIRGYDERLGAGSPGGAGEDLDLLYQLLRKGARIQYEPDVFI
jgi:glycosyltransferase involved in cell wall biosynthesis